MASNDVRDILEVAPSSEARPAKKQKISAQQKNQFAGMSKEVRGLMLGDGIAPVQVQEIQYKKKPKIAKRSQPWIREPFMNPARNDGLILKHWRKATVATRPETPGAAGGPVTPAESKTENETENKTSPAVQTNYHFARYNTKPSGPKYTDEEYEAHLKNADWSRAETDYLIETALDFDLRWVVIWDRYDFQPKETAGTDDAMAVTITPKPRSMEELKARYYEVSAKMMALHHPLANMSTAEFDLYEKMTKFDPVREMTRKRLAEALLARTPEELREEEILLGELKRIVDNEERFLEERKELYQRLDYPLAHGSISMYESSTGLGQLMQTLLASDKNKKRRSLMGPNESNASPAQPMPTPTTSGPGRAEHRASISERPTKKGSVSNVAQFRQLSPREEAKFGVIHHDRLSSGVHFRQSRIEKLVLAKSAAQQQKLHDALAEVGVPVKAVMPTDRVCKGYERLVAGVHLLLDTRKVSEKVNNEIRILKAQKEAREKKERGSPEGTPVPEESKETEVKDEDADAEVKAERQREEDNESDAENNDRDRDNEDEDQEGGNGRGRDDDEENGDANAQDEEEAEIQENNDSENEAAAERASENNSDAENEEDGQDHGRSRSRAEQDQQQQEEDEEEADDDDDDDDEEARHREEEEEDDREEEQHHRELDNDNEDYQDEDQGEENDEDGGEEGERGGEEEENADADEPSVRGFVSGSHKRTASDLSDASDDRSKRSRK